MDDQRTDRASGGRLKRIARSLFLSVLIGALVLGALFGLEGINYAVSAGPEIPNKGGEPYTRLEWVALQFFSGIFVGGFIGAIGWSVLTAFDWLKRFFPTT